MTPVRPNRPAGSYRLAGHHRFAGLLALALTLWLSCSFGGIGAAATPSPSPAALTDTSVTLQVVNLSPTTPAISATPQPLRFTLSLTNTTAVPLNNLTLSVHRDVPTTQLASLEDDFGSPSQASPTAIVMHSEQLAPLPAHTTRTETYVATASTLDDGSSDICLCATGIYPIDFTISASASSDGSTTTVARAQSYVPSFLQSPVPMKVSWVWPLIDRPHRVTADQTFFDDDLGASVAPGGRLYRSLSVLEGIQSFARVTLMVDPELISELLAMSDRYEVTAAGTPGAATPAPASASASTTPSRGVVDGTHSQDAANWLARFHNVAAVDQVEFTPDADPDTESMVRANLQWSTTVDPSVAGQATGVGAHDLAWPADGVATEAGIKSLIAGGAQTLILSDSVLPAMSGSSVPPSSAALLDQTRPDGSKAQAVVTDSVVQDLAATAVGVSTQSSVNTAALPKLVSAVAMRAVADPTNPSYLVITAPRDVDPSVAAAVRAIRETSATYWSSPITVNDAVSTLTPDERDSLTAPGDGSSTSATMIHTSATTADFVRDFTPIFVSAADAARVLTGYPAAAQRAASNGWRGHDVAAQTFNSTLNRQVDTLQSAVRIVRPTTGSYTLASSDAPLFVSVLNTLAYPVRVKIAIATVGTVRGVTTDDTGVHLIQGNGSQVTLRIPAHAQRPGRFVVQATLLTPLGASLGDPVQLDVRSTALGGVGVVITVIAAVVLAVALLLRLIRRLRRGRTPPPSEPPAPLHA
ncbi:hypothetical protein SAMN05444157_0382 [Frankineae bacterium MT45]|nr:hypothetical protein SAMN05444157_0382 [Frankineae bacterium MT45]